MTVPLFIREHEVRALLPMAECVEAVERAFLDLADGSASSPPRLRVSAPNGLLHLLPGSVPAAGGIGVKVYPGFFGRGQGHLLVLFGTGDGRLEGIIEADWLGRVRTGAASGVATRALSRPDARVLALFGTGRQAEQQALGIAAVRPLKEIRVHGRDAEHLRQFCARLDSQVDARLIPVRDPRAALDGADVVATATRSKEPLFDAAWLGSGVHINATGSNVATHRELDDETVRGAKVIAVDAPDQADHEAGTLLRARDSGALAWHRVVPLADILSGAAPGRTSSADRTLFVSLGMGIEDVATGMLVVRRAGETGLGLPLPVSPPS